MDSGALTRRNVRLRSSPRHEIANPPDLPQCNRGGSAHIRGLNARRLRAYGIVALSGDRSRDRADGGRAMRALEPVAIAERAQYSLAWRRRWGAIAEVALVVL